MQQQVTLMLRELLKTEVDGELWWSTFVSKRAHDDDDDDSYSDNAY